MASNVVNFPPKRPVWLYLVAGRLMVRKDRPLADLHRMARLAGLSRRSYRPSSLAPHYRLSGRAIARCIRIFGPMPVQPQVLRAALDLASRQGRSRPEPSAR